MARFKYTALAKDGERVSGIMEGSSEQDAASRIKQEYDVIVKITEVKEKGDGILNREVGRPKLNQRALTVLCGQFAVILKADVPVDHAVRLLIQKTPDRSLSRLLEQTAADVESGKSLADAFEEHGSRFLPLTFLETVRAGEESGNLAGAFAGLHEHYEKQDKLYGRVRGAMTYPLLVLALAVVTLVVLMVRIVPTFTTLFETYGATLPLVTQALVAVSEFLRTYTWIILVVGASLFALVKLYEITESGRVRLAKLCLHLPLWGKIQLLNGASQFAGTMTTLLNAGLPVNRAVSVTAQAMDNYYLRMETGKLSVKLEEGQTLGESMRQQRALPSMLADTTAAGEAAGRIEAALRDVGQYYDGQLETAVRTARAQLEPALLLLISLAAGFIVVAIYMAMFTLYTL